MGIILSTSPGGETSPLHGIPFRPENNRPCSARENAPSKREDADSKPQLNAYTVGENQRMFCREVLGLFKPHTFPPFVMVEGIPLNPFVEELVSFQVAFPPVPIWPSRARYCT